MNEQFELNYESDEPQTVTQKLSEEFFHDARDGTHCPVCKRFGKIYRKGFDAGMAFGLICMYKEDLLNPGQPIHVRDVYRRRQTYAGGNFAQMFHWDMIEPVVNFDTTKKESGLWILKERGVQFALRKIRVPKYILIYNSNNMGYDGDETVDIVEALRNNFNYEETMNA